MGWCEGQKFEHRRTERADVHFLLSFPPLDTPGFSWSRVNSCTPHLGGQSPEHRFGSR